MHVAIAGFHGLTQPWFRARWITPNSSTMEVERRSRGIPNLQESFPRLYLKQVALWFDEWTCLLQATALLSMDSFMWNSLSVSKVLAEGGNISGSVLVRPSTPKSMLCIMIV